MPPEEHLADIAKTIQLAVELAQEQIEAGPVSGEGAGLKLPEQGAAGGGVKQAQGTRQLMDLLTQQRQIVLGDGVPQARPRNRQLLTQDIHQLSQQLSVAFGPAQRGFQLEGRRMRA